MDATAGHGWNVRKTLPIGESLRSLRVDPGEYHGRFDDDLRAAGQNLLAPDGRVLVQGGADGILAAGQLDQLVDKGVSAGDPERFSLDDP